MRLSQRTLDASWVACNIVQTRVGGSARMGGKMQNINGDQSSTPTHEPWQPTHKTTATVHAGCRTRRWACRKLGRLAIHARACLIIEMQKIGHFIMQTTIIVTIGTNTGAKACKCQWPQRFLEGCHNITVDGARIPAT